MLLFSAIQGTNFCTSAAKVSYPLKSSIANAPVIFIHYTPPTGNIGAYDFIFQSPSTSPYPVGHADGYSHALSLALQNRKFYLGIDLHVKKHTFPLHCGNSNFYQNKFKNTISVKKFGSRSGPTFWSQTVCKGYQQMSKDVASKERIKFIKYIIR